MAVSKRTRFEVLRRDDYTCRYCGQCAPDVKLTIDHVVPSALGGSDDPSNLVPACKDCNSGKASTSPDERTVAEVDAQAFQWARAMRLAGEAAGRERAEQAENLAAFRAEWTRYHYTDTPENVPLPSIWEVRVRELLQGGLTLDDLREAVTIAMAKKGCDNEFAYFLGVCRQKTLQRAELARELIRRGVV